MYVYGVPSPSKLGLGSYLRGPRRRGMAGLGYRPNQAVQRIFRQRPVNPKGSRGLPGTFRGVGQDETDNFASTSSIFTDPFGGSSSSGSYTNPLSDVLTTPDYSTDLSDQVQPNPLTSFTSTPSTALTASQAFAQLQASATPITDASDYVSPSAAIAGGVPAAQVNAVWATSQGVNSFPSQAAATSALTATLGAAQAAATVAKLWTGGGAAPPTSAAGGSFLTSSTGGIPNVAIIGGLAVVLLVGFMGGGK